MSEIITSRQNSLFKQLKALDSRAGREKAGLYSIEGIRLIEEAIAANVPIAYAVYSNYLEQNHRGKACLATLAQLGIQPRLVDDGLLRELANTERPQGLLIAARLPDSTCLAKSFWQGGSRFLVVDGVQDPGNLGTILRTSEAFGVDRVVLLKGTVDAYNDKVVRSAMGATFRLPIVRDQVAESVLAQLQQEDVQIIATSLAADIAYNQAAYAERWALVVGNEGDGIAPLWENAADLKVIIPLAEPVESLNVAIATAILLAHMAKKH